MRLPPPAHMGSRTSLALLVVVLALLFAALPNHDTAAAQESCTAMLIGDGPVDGDWTTDDCLSENRPSGADYYARYYTFTLSEEAEVVVTLEGDPAAGDADTYLYLLEGVGTSGAVLHENDDHAGETDCATDLARDTDSCIAATLDAGDYTIEVTTYDAGVTGEFTLTVEGLPAGAEPDASSDRATLVTLYNATDGDNWTENENWLSDKPLGEWHGVATDADGRVTWIELSSNNLEGTLPWELGNFDELERLYLHYNQLKGEIPSELGNLSNLYELILHGNRLEGDIPPEMGNSSNLSELWLSDNQLTGSIPTELSNLTELALLSLWGNQLDGGIPPELGNLSNLESLYLHQNQLSGEIPSELGSLTSLKALFLDDNQLSGEVPSELLAISGLRYMTLYGNRLSGGVPEHASETTILTTFYNSTGGTEWSNNENWASTEPVFTWQGVGIDTGGHVARLGLSDNQLVGELPPELGNLNNLLFLFLRGNQLTGAIPPEMGDLSNLEGLYLSGNELTGEIPPKLGNLANLSRLDLDNNQLTGAIPVELGNLTELERLYLSANELTGEIPPELGNLANLQILSLGLNQLTGEIPPELGNLTNLRTLWLSPNDFTGCVPAALRDISNSDLDELGLHFCDEPPPIVECLHDCQLLLGIKDALIGDGDAQLNWDADLLLSHWTGVTTDDEQRVIRLELSESGLSGSIPPLLGDLHELRVLDLWRNSLTGEIPEELGSLSNLETLRLGGNTEITGPIPPELGNLTNLRELWLGDGIQLSGEIPDSLGNLANLEVLDLGGDNDLSTPDGGIPAWLEDKVNLRRLYLDSNRLTGEIPSWLGNLTRLERLVLEDNQLTGEIPRELGKLTELQRLGLSRNQLTGPVPPELGNLTELRSLALSRNEFSGSIPSQLGNLSNLRELTLHVNQLEGDIPPELGDLTNLRGLWLDRNQLTGTIPAELGSLSNLENLYLHNNQLSGELPPKLGNLTNLIRLSLGTNEFTSGEIPDWLRNLNRLEILDIPRIQLRGEVPAWLGDLTNLRNIALWGNQLTGELPHSLTALTSLEDFSFSNNDGLCAPTDEAFQNWLQSIGSHHGPNCPDPDDRAVLAALYNATNGDNWTENENWLSDKPLGEWHGVTTDGDGRVSGLNLSENSLAGTIPSDLTNLTELRGLALFRNQLSGEIPASLGNLTELGGLQLYSNQLTGVIPPELGNLSNLRELVLHANQLEGSIPPELGNLTNLDSLFLDDNQLTGNIPPELGNLANLERLNLSRNRLSGEVPPELGNLTNLWRLRLADNELTGCIPEALRDVEDNDLDELGLDFCDDVQLPPCIDTIGESTSFSARWTTDDCLSGNRPDEGDYYARFYTFSLADSAEVTIAVTSEQDTFAYLLEGVGTSGTVLHENDDHAGETDCDSDLANTTDSCIAATLDAGNYTIEVTTFAPEVMGEFTITVNGVGAKPDPLTVLLDEIIDKTEQREAFSEVKESRISFSPLEDMEEVRSEFVASETGAELYYALVKLSNARRDRHLRVSAVLGGLQPPQQECISAPIHVLPDLSDIQNPEFFVAAVDEGLTSPEAGDVIVAVNDRSIDEYIEEFTFWIRHSTLRGLYWRMAGELPTREANVPPRLYSEQLNLTLEDQSGQRYDVSLPYSSDCVLYYPISPLPGFVEAMSRENFNVLVDRSRQIILLQWLDFEYSLIQDIADLMDYAEREQILDYDMIIDVTFSSGGSRGAYAIQRLVDQPFRTTFGNVRLSDLGIGLIEEFASQEPNTDAPDISGLNLSRSWLIDWARTDAMDAIRRGDEYTPAVPFKLAHLPKDSDGVLEPAPVHFSGEVAIINGRTRGGSHLDQFVAMFVDNDLADFVGVPTGGYSNTWEGTEVLRFSDTGQPVVEFMWSLGHTIRPNGEVLEGNPAQPDNLTPLTRQNYRDYHQMLLDEAIAALDATDSGSVADDRAALVALYNATDGDNWTENENWLSDKPLGEWHGVSTDDNGRVTELSLWRNNLTGSIPPALGDLDELYGLSLAQNQLRGEIPSEIGGLSELMWLQLSGNQLSGGIPPELGNLPNLFDMNLGWNQLEGNIPPELGNLPNLTWLYLHNNQLSGEVPPELLAISGLGYMTLYGNRISGGVPEHASEANILSVLYNSTGGAEWSSNENWASTEPVFTWQGVGIGTGGHVAALWLGWNQLTGQIPPELGNLVNLRELSLRHNQLAGTIPAELGNLTNLRQLWLGSNQLTGAIPPELGNLSNLQGLRLSDNGLTGIIPPELSDLTSLWTLQLAGNELTGCIPEALREIENNDLDELGLDFCDDVQLPPCIDTIGESTSFSDRWTTDDCTSENRPDDGDYYARYYTFSLADAAEVTIAVTSERDTVLYLLEGVGKSGAVLHENDDHADETDCAADLARDTDSCIAATLDGGDYTVEVTAYDAGVTGEFTLTVEGLPASVGPEASPDRAALVALYNATDGDNWTENENWLSDEPLGEWHGIDTDDEGRVTRLRLAENGLNGAIPAELGNLSYLRDLGLSDNQLTGTIPPELGNLTNLTYLGLPNNQLTGQIPLALGSLSKLRILELHRNKFSGTIPLSLGSLSNLEYLWLHRNQLTGSIPSELGNLDSLKRLGIMNNQLTGTVPAELGNLSNLEYLGLGSNRLTGELPTSLTALTSLENFYFGGGNDGLCAPTDDEFQAWLSAIPNHSGPECLPDLPPAEIIQDPVISYLTWYVGEGVKQEELQRAMDGARLMHEYAASRGYPETDEEINAYFYHDLEQIAVAYARVAGWSLDDSRAHWEGKRVGAVAGRGWIVFKVSAPLEPPHSGIYGIAIHEFAHSAYQHRLAGLQTGSSDEYPRGYTDPRWFGEGMATLLTALLTSGSDGDSYADERESRVKSTYEVDLPLSEAETWPDSSDPEYDRIRRCIYDCGMIAVELLASHVGLGALTDFYTMLHPDDTWQQAFETAFGMSIDEFYDLFEEHRAAGFPVVELPQP